MSKPAVHRVMGCCPNTEIAVPTGLVLDARSFETAIIRQNEFDCPACNFIHIWDKRSAWLEGISRPRTPYTDVWALDGLGFAFDLAKTGMTT